MSVVCVVCVCMCVCCVCVRTFMYCVCPFLQQGNRSGGDTVPIEIREKLRDTQMAFKNLLAMVQQLSAVCSVHTL